MNRSALEELKRTGFDLEKKMGINFLFERLLKDPIRNSKWDMYIVIDRPDEAEYGVQDDLELKPQLDILIECLANFPRCRLIVISRPPSDVLKIVPVAITRSITIQDNREDIKTYVEVVCRNRNACKDIFKRWNWIQCSTLSPSRTGYFSG